MPQLYLTRFLGQRIAAWPALREVLQGMEAGLLELIWWGAARTRDPDIASDLGERLGQRIGRHLRKHHQVLDNLRTGFPAWPPERVEATARAIWGNLGRVVAEYPFLARIADPAEGRIRITDLGGLEEVRRSGRPGIFVSAHLANWNLLPLAAIRVGLPLTVVYTKEKNPRLEARFDRWRAATGCAALPIGNAGRQALRLLQQGQSLGLLVDQRYDKGEAIPFLGLPAPTTVGPARLALRFGVPLVPVRVERRHGASFAITVQRPIRPEPGLPEEEAARRMTAALNGLLGRWIAETPEQWLCVKHRWPTAYRRRVK
jgi:KDO2-lipid IV(A) lauroyltransferase